MARNTILELKAIILDRMFCKALSIAARIKGAKGDNKNICEIGAPPVVHHATLFHIKSQITTR